MSARRLILAALALVLPASATVAVLPRHGTEVAVPANFAAGVLYASVDRADTGQQLELFAPPAALAAARQGTRSGSAASEFCQRLVAQLYDSLAPGSSANWISPAAFMSSAPGAGAGQPSAMAQRPATSSA